MCQNKITITNTVFFQKSFVYIFLTSQAFLPSFLRLGIYDKAKYNYLRKQIQLGSIHNPKMASILNV